LAGLSIKTMHERLHRILSGLGFIELLPIFLKEKVDDALLPGLTDSDLKEIGIEKLGDRKRLLQEFARLAGAGVAPMPPRQAKPAPVKVAVKAAVQPAGAPFCNEPMQASPTRPFLNSLGMPFVPLTRGKSLCCRWPVRIRDYMQFAMETGAGAPVSDFPQGPDHPVVNVRWNDARRFCKWLTKRELWLELIPTSLGYRLPKDEEWSGAVGLGFEGGPTPKMRSGVVEGYPWGEDFPPPPGAGNYHPKLQCDAFPETSPVGSFAPNKLGICDLGGNVWEWCLDEYEKGNPDRVLRGASCFNDDPFYLMSSFRDHYPGDKARNNVGIRVVLAPSTDEDPWSNKD
jgi:hypothetical protein